MVAIFCGVSGRLDKVPVEEVARYEREVLQYMRQSHPELLDRILSERQESTSRLNADLEQVLNAALDEFERRVWGTADEAVTPRAAG